MKPLLLALLAVASLSAQKAPAKTTTFIGTVIDDMCATTGHAAMRMGPTDAECAVACVQAHGATYVLLTASKKIYTLKDQKLSEQWAGYKVKIVGALDAKGTTIEVVTIAVAK